VLEVVVTQVVVEQVDLELLHVIQFVEPQLIQFQ
jgi:hypothetical protein